MKLLQIDFAFTGPFGEELTSVSRVLAHDIAKAPGLRWKIWTESQQTSEAGGLYLFDDLESAEKYLAIHRERLRKFGVHEIRVRIWDVLEELTQITRGPIPTTALPPR
jgi:hypothetical protein